MRNMAMQLRLKPETRRMLLLCGIVFLLLFTAAFAYYYFAGNPLDYQQGLILSERLAKGLRTGFGFLCLGVLFMESR